MKILNIVRGEFSENLTKAASALLMKVLGILAHFLIILLISRQFGVIEVGIFSLALTLLQFSATFGKGGMDSAAMKYQSESFAIDKKQEATNYFWICIINALISSTVVATLLLVFKNSISSFFGIQEYENLVFLIAICVIPMSLTFVVGESFKARKKVGTAIFFSNTSRFFLGLILLSAAIKFEYVSSPFTVFSWAVFLTFILSIPLFFRQKLNIGQVWNKWLNENMIIVAFAIPMLLVSTIQLSTQQINILMLGAMTTEIEVGNFSVIQKISMILTLPLFALNAIAAPLISRFFKNQQPQKIMKLTKLISLVVFASSIPLFSVALFFPELPLGLFGSEYEILAKSLIVISIGQLVNSLCGSVGFVLQLCDKHRLYRNLVFVTIGIIVISSFFLIPLFGTLGACISNSLGMIFLNISSSIYVKREFGFVPTFLFKN